MSPIFSSYCRVGATLALAVLACGCTVPCNDAALSGAWEKELSSIRGNAILPASDGGYFIAGSIGDPGPFSSAAIVTKVDSTGEEIWSTTFPDQDFSSARQIAPAPDGSVFVSGGSDRHAHVARVDSDGTILWARTFADDVWLGHTSAAALDDGTLALAMYSRKDVFAHFGQTQLLKIDSNGNVLWSRTLNEVDDVMPHSLVRGTDGGVVLLASEFIERVFSQEEKITIPGEHQVRLAHLAGDDGTISWSHVVEGELLSWTTPAAPTPDGGFILLGRQTRRYGSILYPVKTLIIRIDPD